MAEEKNITHGRIIGIISLKGGSENAKRAFSGHPFRLGGV